MTTEFAWEKKMLEDERDALRAVMAVAAAAALHSGDQARTERYAHNAEVYSASVVRQLRAALQGNAAWEEPIEDGHWPDRRPLFAAGVSGDAAAVVRQLVEQKSTGRDVLPRIMPLLRVNRSAVATWSATQFPAPCLTCGASSLVGHLSDRREVARLVGTKDERDRLLSVVTRFVDALTDPATAFEIDEVETFFGTKR